MSRARSVIVLFALFVSVAAGSAACSNSNPAGPSTSGATINGSLIADRAMSGVTVSVSGTNLGAAVGSSQQFTIHEVPAGSVRLLFRGPALNGAIDLSGVRDADTIEVRVRVNGSSVSLESENRRHDDDNDDDDDDEDEVEFSGTLTSRTGLAPNLTLIVGGRTVRTNAGTEIRTRHGGNALDFSALVLGQTLEVKGNRQPDASIVARRIRVGN